MGRVTFLPSRFSMTDEQAMWRVQTQDDHRAFVQLLERSESENRMPNRSQKRN